MPHSSNIAIAEVPECFAQGGEDAERSRLRLFGPGQMICLAAASRQMPEIGSGDAGLERLA